MITCEGINYEKIQFPCGEIHVRLKECKSSTRIVFDFEKSEEILELLLLVNALRMANVYIFSLEIPYIPFGRQDRVAAPGDSFSLKVFADLINGLDIPLIYTNDPHSDVTPALIKNLDVCFQFENFLKFLESKENFYLISPDSGASKKIYKLAQLVNCVDVVECSKVRDPKTGDIKKLVVSIEDLGGKDCYIVDDICDGGRTFIEIAKKLKERSPGKIALMVSHGFFTKGLEVFDGLIDEIYTRKGRIK